MRVISGALFSMGTLYIYTFFGFFHFFCFSSHSVVIFLSLYRRLKLTVFALLSLSVTRPILIMVVNIKHGILIVGQELMAI